MKRLGGVEPAVEEERADQRLDHVADDIVALVAPSSRACLPRRMSAGTPISRPTSAQVSRATSAL